MEDIYGKLQKEEKAKMFTGLNTWQTEPINGKSLFLSDGPLGIRKEYQKEKVVRTVKAICYPSASLSACSFNPDLMNKLGAMLGKEAIKNGIDILLGPGINIKRNPLCGRNFEYFSEDPYLTGKLASAYINGLQAQNVGACLKHLACNQQEYARFINDSIVDERALHEIYLKAFEMAIKESNPWSIMVSYNKLNGIRATENKYLLTDIVRNKFGFKGAFISDWGAIDKSYEALMAGLDLEMPGLSKGSDKKILSAIKDQKMDIKYLNESSKRLVDLYIKSTGVKIDDFDYDNGLRLALEINNESIVLLKNEDNILPLKKEEKIALIGDFSANPRFQGGGSSRINSIFLSTLNDELNDENVTFTYARGYNPDSLVPYKEMIVTAVNDAKKADKVILVVGLPPIIESEGYDREDMHLPKSHLALIDAIYEVNKNIVLILQNGAPVEMPFIDKCKGVIEGYLGGSMHARGLKNVLYGHVNPSGRLAESFPLKYEDVSSSKYYSINPYYSLYKESIFIGYRYFNTFNIPVLFPFGYGLSYSDVSYSNYNIERIDNIVRMSFTLKNNSNLACKEVVEAYVGAPTSRIVRAKKELKGFIKVALEPYEEKSFTIDIDIDSLKYFDIEEKKYKLEGTVYRFYLSKHVNDDSNYLDLKIESNDKCITNYPSIYKKMNRDVTDLEFIRLLGYRPKMERVSRPFTTDSPIIEISKSFLGFIILRPITRMIVRGIKDKLERKMVKLSIPYQPIRSIQVLTDISKEQIEALVDIFNNHPIKGIKKYINGKTKKE